MKLLYVYKDYFPVLGGIENHTRQLAEEMSRRGHQVEVLVTNTGRTTRHDELNGVRIFKAGRWLNVSSAPLSPRLGLEVVRRLTLRSRPDLIHLQGPYPPGEAAWLMGSFLAGNRRPPTVLTYQSDIVRQKRLLTLYAPILKRVLRRVDLILTSSPNYIESSDFLRPLADHCRAVPLGVNYARFAQASAHTTRPANSEAVQILFTGRLRYYKGLQYLIEAMPQVRPEGRLIIIGIGPMEADLRAQVARLGLGERVTFTGEVSDADLPGYYARADLFVLPSCERSEAYGLVLLEAMAAGLPVVCTELGTGTSFINQNGQTGLVVPPSNPTALAVALNELIGDPARRLEMGQRASQRVVSEFNLEKMCDQIEQIYIELSSGG